MSTKGQNVFPFESRSAFVISLLVSFVIIFGVACIVAYQSYTKAVEATIRSNETKASLLSKLILEHQRAAIGVLQSYADRPLLVDSVNKRDFEGALRHLIDLAKHNPEMDWPFLSNPDSTVWVNYPVDNRAMGKDLSYRDWYKGVKKEWKPYISSVYKLIVGEKDLAVAVSAPVLDEKGKVIGILSTAQSTAFFRKIIGEVGLNLDSKTTLIDQEGHIIYSNGFPYTKEVIAYSDFEFVRKAMKGEKGDLRVRDPSDGNRIKYVSFAPIEGIGWSILVEKTRSDVLRSELSSLVLIGVISLLIYGVVVLFLIHSRERHRHIKGLEKLNEELDGRVRERTAELEAGNTALRDSEERYRSLFNGMTEGFALHEILCDEKGEPCDYRFLEINPAFEHLTGLRREDVVGKTMSEVLPNDDPEWVKVYGKVALTGRSTHFDNYSAVLKRHYEVFAYCPAPRQFGALFMDITERKRAEEALRKSEQRWATTLASIGDAVIATDLAGKITFMNRVAEELTGWTLSEASTKPVAGVFHIINEHTRNRVEDPVAKVLKEGVIVGLANHTVLVEKSGREIPIDDSGAPIRDGDGRLIGVVLVFRDITERKRTLEVLRENEARLRRFYESGLLGVLYWNMDGEITDANDKFLEMVGYDREDLKAGRIDWGNMTPSEHRHLDEASVKELKTTGVNKLPFEKEFIRKDGSRIPIILAGAMLDEARFNGVAFVLDITERKQAEEVIRESEARYRSLFEHMLDGFAYCQMLFDEHGCPEDFVYLAVNDAFGRLTGLKDVIDKRVTQVIPRIKELNPELFQIYGRVALTGNPERFEIDFKPLGLYLSVSVYSPAKSYFVAVFDDITERKRTEKALRRNELRFELLAETAGRLLAAENPQSIIEELCRKVMVHLDCHAFFNFLVDEQSGRLRLNACAGIPEEEAGKLEWLDYGVAVCGCVARDGARIIAEDIFKTPDPRTELVKSYGIQAYCCHPLMVRGRLIGTLSFGTKTRQHFTPEEVETMRIVVDQVAMAMDRIMLLESARRSLDELEIRVKERTADLADLSSQLVSAQEKERQRVSYDLHDNVWQMLVTIRFAIDNLFSGQENWGALRNKSRQVMANIVELVGKIRSMQGDLWPYVLDDIGLVATIEWYCREFEKSHPNVTVERHDGLAENEVPSSVKIVIYRILQETLSNVVKHSQASRVALRLMKNDHRVEFAIQDNGIGFDPEEIVAKRTPWGGLGLLSIKARTELSGGRFGIESSKDKGAIVRASWPT